MEAVWAVRFVTAVEAVRRKRKADVRFWLGLGLGVEVGVDCIAGHWGGRERESELEDWVVVDLHATGSGYSANARLLVCFYGCEPHSSSSTSSSLKSSSSSSISIFGTPSPSSVCSVSATLAVSSPSIRSFAFFSC